MCVHASKITEHVTAVLRVREVSSGNGRVLGIQVDNSYISLPGELFENLNESGIMWFSYLFYEYSMFSFSFFLSLFQYLSQHSIMQTYLICSREARKKSLCI